MANRPTAWNDSAGVDQNIALVDSAGNPLQSKGGASKYLGVALVRSSDGNEVPMSAPIDGDSAGTTGVYAYAKLQAYNGVGYDRVRALTAFDNMGLGAGSLSTLGQGLLYNGTGWDRQRGNTEGTLLASAARTANTSSPVQTNYNARGIIVTLDVTAASGTGGLQLRIYPVDPVTAKVGQSVFPASTPITAIATYTYVLYPGAAATAGPAAISALVLPRTWQAAVAHADSSSYTYSLGYSLIV